MTLNDEQRFLEQFNLNVRLKLELAEAKVPHINALIERVAAIGLLTDVALMGDVMIQRPYPARSGIINSAQILQATILVPGGLGAVIWDSDELEVFRRDPAGIGREAANRFMPFGEMSAGERALLMVQLAPLLLRFSKIINVLAVKNG